MDIVVFPGQGNVAVTILQPHGSVDASTYKALIAKAREVYGGGSRFILLDLSDTPYLSSAGLVALQSIAALLRGDTPPDLEQGWGAFHAAERDREKGFQRNLKLFNPQPYVERTLEKVGFTRFFEIYTDMEAAITSFSVTV